MNLHESRYAENARRNFYFLFFPDDYDFDGNFLRFRINAATERWVFQALQ